MAQNENADFKNPGILKGEEFREHSALELAVEIRKRVGFALSSTNSDKTRTKAAQLFPLTRILIDRLEALEETVSKEEEEENEEETG